MPLRGQPCADARRVPASPGVQRTIAVLQHRVAPVAFGVTRQDQLEGHGGISLESATSPATVVTVTLHTLARGRLKRAGRSWRANSICPEISCRFSGRPSMKLRHVICALSVGSAIALAQRASSPRAASAFEAIGPGLGTEMRVTGIGIISLWRQRVHGAGCLAGGSAVDTRGAGRRGRQGDMALQRESPAE